LLGIVEGDGLTDAISEFCLSGALERQRMIGRSRLYVSGHIHAGYGTLRTSDTVFVNASLLGDSGKLDRKPIVIDLQAR
jgi:hypothetical protein